MSAKERYNVDADADADQSPGAAMMVMMAMMGNALYTAIRDVAFVHPTLAESPNKYPLNTLG